MEKLRREYASRPAPATDTKVRVLEKPARRMWDRDSTDFRLFDYARERLNLVESVMNNAQYLRGKHISGNEPKVVSIARIEVSNNTRQIELLF